MTRLKYSYDEDGKQPIKTDKKTGYPIVNISSKEDTEIYVHYTGYPENLNVPSEKDLNDGKN